MKRKWLQKTYLKSAAVVLLAAAVFKMFSLLHRTPFLAENDPVFYFLTNYNLLYAVIFLEMIIGLTILNASKRIEINPLCRILYGEFMGFFIFFTVLSLI